MTQAPGVSVFLLLTPFQFGLDYLEEPENILSSSRCSTVSLHSKGLLDFSAQSLYLPTSHALFLIVPLSLTFTLLSPLAIFDESCID
jgi:hypothetical protein